MRIISLIASSTELVHALGLGQYMVGRSHECDYPDSVLGLPVCTKPGFKVEGTSSEIDARVKEVLEKSLSVYLVDAEIIDSLTPTHIITQAQCEVCAVSLKDVEAAACNFFKSDPTIISLQPDCLADFFADLERLGGLMNCPEQAERLACEMQSRIAAVSARASRAIAHPRVAIIEWIEPLMAAGNWMPELVELAGGINLFGKAGTHSPYMTFEDLVASDPDVIVITPCGFDNARTLTETHLLFDRAEFRALKAVREKRVYVADGNQYFNRPGPRLIDSLEILQEIFYPDEKPKYRNAWLGVDS